MRSHTDSPYQHRCRSSAQGWLNGRGPSTQKAENHRKHKGDTVKTDGSVLSAVWLSSIRAPCGQILPLPTISLAINAVSIAGGGKLGVWRKLFRLIYILCFALRTRLASTTANCISAPKDIKMIASETCSPQTSGGLLSKRRAVL